MSPKEQDGTQSRRTETGGSPHPANNRPDEWVVKREGWGSPNLTLNSGFSLKNKNKNKIKIIKNTRLAKYLSTE